MKHFAFVMVLLSALTLGAQDLSVLTYNIKYDNPTDSINGWNNRKDFLISQLKYNHPDVFGTQEGLHHQLEDLKQGLSDYDYFGVGRDFGDARGEFTAIFYNFKNLEVLEQNTFWLSEESNKPSKGWDAALNRTCTYALFRAIKTNEKFLVFNTHFDHVGELARKESTFLILKKIKEVNTANLPVVLMGDFNLEQQSEGIQTILKTYNDTHLVTERAFGPTGTFNGFDFKKPVTRKIDFIFTSKKIKVFKSGILSDSKDCHYPSDHFPVYVELNLSHDE